MNYTLLAGLILLLAACGHDADSPAAPIPDSTPTPSPGAGSLVVAWVADGELFVWQGSDPPSRRIAGADVIRAFLSPDGAQVAYLRGPGGDPQSLWISDRSGSGARLLIESPALVPDDPTRRPWQIVWVADQLYFNTLTGEQVGTRTADDLWRADPVSGTVERLLPDGEGGSLVPAPDGSRLALAAAGDYTQPGETPRAPGSIAFYDPATGERRTAFEFPAVATGSEWRWYPALRWLPDSSGVLAAIPDPDLIYGSGQTALWRLPIDGDPAPTGTVDADFFGLPVFSADGAWIAYIARRESPAQAAITLMVAAQDGTGAGPYAEGGVGSLGVAHWLPAASRFVFPHGAPGEFWLGGPGIAPIRFPADEVLVGEIVWAGPAAYVVSTRVDDAPALLWGTFGTPTLQTITLLDTAPFFDAVSG